MLNGDPQDGFFNPIITLMIDYNNPEPAEAIRPANTSVDTRNDLLARRIF